MMSSFDFGIQFLHADKMTYWGRHHCSFWIKNAGVELERIRSAFPLRCTGSLS
jgi:hypothetical protein